MKKISYLFGNLLCAFIGALSPGAESKVFDSARSGVSPTSFTANARTEVSQLKGPGIDPRYTQPVDPSSPSICIQFPERCKGTSNADKNDKRQHDSEQANCLKDPNQCKKNDGGDQKKVN